jgi:hypothetical protein
MSEVMRFSEGREVLPAMELAERTDAGTRRWVELMAPAVELAKHVSNTHFVPAGLRGRPDAIVAAILYGDELGLGPMRSLSWIAIIDGKPSIASEGYRALILAAGHEVWPVEQTNTRVTMAGRRRGEDRVVEVTWTADDAKRAGLSGKSNWRAYPRAMLAARATAELARLLFADVLGGFGISDEETAFEDAGTSTPPEGAGGGAGKGDTAPKARRRRRTPEPPPPSTAGAPHPPNGGTLPPGEAQGTADSSSPDWPKREEVQAAAEDALLGAAAEDVTEQAERDVDAAIEAMSAEADAVIAREKALAERATEDVEATPMMTAGQRAKMHALFREREVESRDSKLSYCSTVTRREIATSNELTEAEAEAVIENLLQWNPQDPNSKPFKAYDPSAAEIPY